MKECCQRKVNWCSNYLWTVNVKYTIIKHNLYFMVYSIDIYRSWVMALFLLENRNCLGFRMIFKVWLNQICSNFNTMLWTIKYLSYGPFSLRKYGLFRFPNDIQSTTQKFTNSCNWQCSKLSIACQINLNQITCNLFLFSFTVYIKTLIIRPFKIWNEGGICDHQINFL
jgi:hypothetical protein